MKIRTLALTLCALAFVATSAMAAASEFGLNAGLALPMGDFADAAGPGFFGGASYTYHVEDMFGLGGDINYDRFGKKSATVGAVSASNEFSAVQYGVHGKYFFKLKSNETPYLKVGLGMYALSDKASSTGGATNYSATTSDTKFGYSLGLGADWKMSEKSSWGIEALYHNIQTDRKSATMITVGARYNWLMSGK